MTTDLSNLSLKQLKILYLRHKKLSYKRIAEETKTTTNYVGVQINRYYDDSGMHLGAVIQTLTDIEDLLRDMRNNKFRR